MIKVIKWIANLLLMLIIILLSSYFLLRVTNKIEIYNVKTGSMENKIHVGDYILIFKKDNYNVGDVVTYTSNNGFITHRIIKIEGDRVTTKGDANNTEDETISSNIIVGKVILSGGILNILINYKYALAGIVLSMYLFSCYFESRKNDESSVLENENNEINDSSNLIQTSDVKKTNEENSETTDDFKEQNHETKEKVKKTKKKKKTEE